MNPVVHFEMPYDDRDRAVAFYEKAFGWKSQLYGQAMGNYVVEETGEMQADGWPTEKGRINGGLFARSKEAQAPNIVIAVENIREHMKRVASLGGTLIPGQKPGEPDEVPGIGLIAYFFDTEGNRVCMIQPTRMGEGAEKPK